MRKINLIVALMFVMINANAQIMRVYHGTRLVATYMPDEVDSVVMVEFSSKAENNDENAGKKVEGTTVINGTTYTKAAGGTVGQCVDMGLKDADGHAILWSTQNLGATSEGDPGAMVSWGENCTEEEGYANGKKTAGYTYKTYLMNSYGTYVTNGNGPFTKYVTNEKFGKVDNKNVLDPQDDPVVINWGGTWRTPTQDEWEMLLDTKKFKWVKEGNSYRVTSLIKGYEGKTILLPHNANATTWCAGSYWTSNLYPDNCYAWGFSFDGSSHVTVHDPYRYFGRMIRPIRIKE